MMDVKTNRNGRILEITIDRPKANAIDVRTSRAMGEAFQQLRDDENLLVGIVTGAGDRFFSAGWDLKAAAGGEPPDADHGMGGFAGLTEYWDLRKPVIAAVNGMAMGGGFELALAADMIVASEHAEFALTEVSIGLVADAGGVIRLPRSLPRPIAMELLMTGRRASAPELAKWGLVNRIVPGAELMTEARALAERVAAGAPLSLQAIKEIDRSTSGASEREAYRIMREGDLPFYRSIYDSWDAVEGRRAWSEKREPIWRGR